MSDAKISVGTILHTRWPRGDWHELRVVGQTSQSWLTEYVVEPEGHEKYKVLKRDLSYNPFPSWGNGQDKYHGKRYKAYTSAGKAALLEERRQLAEFFDLVQAIKTHLNSASFNSSNSEVRRIAEILGLLPAHGIAARSGETALAGLTEGKSPVAEGDAP